MTPERREHPADPRATEPGDSEPRASERRAPEPEGGEPVCLLHLVCPECGRVADEDPPTRCAACGTDLPAD